MQSDSDGSSPRVVFGNKPVLTHCKSVTTMTAGSNSQIPQCPHGCKGKVWRDGHYPQMFGEPIQRFSCCVCGFKFSDPKELEEARKALKQVEKIESMELKSPGALGSNCQICVKETKNLVADQTTTLVIPQKHEKEDQKGAVVEFLYYLEKNEKALSTKSHYVYSLEYLISCGANLFDPFSIKNAFTETLKDKTDARKYCLLKAYKAFANAYGIDIAAAKFKKYKPTRGLPYIPPEAHMDVLIASCSFEMAAFLQTLKESAARPIEAMRILRSEVDFVQNHLPINHPAKNCNPRVIRMTEKLASMLKTLPINPNGKLFRYKNERVAAKTYLQMRKKAIVKLGIPELRKIHSYTFRYWRATVELQETGREIDVAYLLGHTSTKYVTKYAQLAKLYFGGTKKYKSVWVNNREQESAIANEGYEYVRTDPKDGASLYRKLDHTAASTLIGHD